MDPVVDHAICLRQWDYSETSQTAVLFMRKLGIVRVLGKGTKRNDPRFSGGLEVGTLGEAIVHPKESGLATLAGWDLQRTFRGARRTLASHYAVMFALDVPRHLLSENEPHPEAFDALSGVLASLEATGWQGVIARWLWSLLDLAGYRPNVALGSSADGFSPEQGGLVRAAETGGGVVWSVQPETSASLALLADGQDLPHDAAERVGRLLAWYVRELAGREPPTMAPLFGRHHPSTVVRR